MMSANLKLAGRGCTRFLSVPNQRMIPRFTYMRCRCNITYSDGQLIGDLTMAQKIGFFIRLNVTLTMRLFQIFT